MKPPEDSARSEQALLLKLVTTQHLNVPERRALPGGRARASALCEVIVQALRNDGRLPRDWKVDEPFEGGLMELDADGTCRICWKSEVGFMRFEQSPIQEYASLRAGAFAWLRGMFPQGDIDGIPIEWDVES